MLHLEPYWCCPGAHLKPIRGEGLDAGGGMVVHGGGGGGGGHISTKPDPSMNPIPLVLVLVQWPLASSFPSSPIHIGWAAPISTWAVSMAGGICKDLVVLPLRGPRPSAPVRNHCDSLAQPGLSSASRQSPIYLLAPFMCIQLTNFTNLIDQFSFQYIGTPNPSSPSPTLFLSPLASALGTEDCLPGGGVEMFKQGKCIKIAL